MKPTREQIKAALDILSFIPDEGPRSPIERAAQEMAAAYRATRKPAAIIGRMIGYIIAASLILLSLGGLVWAAKMAIRMVAG